MTCQNLLFDRHKTCGTTLKQREKGSIRVFAVFFHPTASVTAMGGAEKRFVEISKFFCRRNDLELTVLESSPSLLNLSVKNCKKYLLPFSFHGKGWLTTYLRWFLWISRAGLKSLSVVNHVKPDVIYVSNNTLPNLILGCFISSVFRLPLCVVVHHVDLSFSNPKNSRTYGLYRSYRNIKYGRLVSLIKTFTFYITLSLLRKKVNTIIAVSNFTAKSLSSNGVSEVKIFVSGNAVNSKLLHSVKSCFDKKVFDGIFVGRIAKEKGVFDLLEVWKRIVKARGNVKLLIVGTGIELASLREKIRELNLENNVFLRGRCSDPELYSLLKSSRFFIFPSLFEGWGLAVAEALACGLPVIAYDIPALRENFGACKSVSLVPVKNLEKLGSAVLKVLNLTEREWCRLSKFSKVYSKQFRWVDVAGKDLEALAFCFESARGKRLF